MRTAPGVQAPGAVVFGWQHSESEMQEIGMFEQMSENLTYTLTTSVLYRDEKGCWGT